MVRRNSVKLTMLIVLGIILVFGFAFASIMIDDLEVAEATDDITSAKSNLASVHGAHDGWSFLSQGGAITSAGRYCLTNDIDAITFPTKTDLFTVEVVICLNGHKITGNGGSAIYIEDDYNVTICDCNGSKSTHHYTVNGDGKYNFNASAGTAGAKSIEGGLIVGGNADKGGGIYNFIGTLSLEAVTVAGNQARVGGGIYVKSGPVVIKSSVIEGNVASESGAGVFADSLSDKFYMESSVIRNNRSSVNGGGMSIGSSDVSVSSTKIVGNTAQGNGGGLFIGDNAYYTNLTDVEIGSNTSNATVTSDDYNAAAGGGGVFVNGGEVSFNGGKIIDNTAANARGGGIFVKGNTVLNLDGTYVSGNSAGVGGGVYVRFSTTTETPVAFNIKGNVKIDGNDRSNVYLYSGALNVISITGALRGDASIGVTLNTSDGKGQIAVGYDTGVQSGVSPAEWFFDDTDAMMVYLDGSSVKFTEHRIDGIEYTAVTSTSDIVQGTSLADMKYYYLKSDITGSLNVTGYITLDLNGKIFRNDSVGATINVSSGLLNITDSKPAVSQYYVLEDVGYNESRYNFNATADTPGAQVVKGGVITDGLGSGINVEGGSLSLKGGTIAGNTARSGSGIYISGGNVEISGGGVYGNVSENGDNIYVGEGGTLNVSGGRIAKIVGGNNVNITGGLFTDGSISAHSVYGLPIGSGCTIAYIDSEEVYPQYTEGYHYIVFGSDQNIHEEYGIPLYNDLDTIDGKELTDGYYFLAENLSLASPIVINGDVTLCLHGHIVQNVSANNASGNITSIKAFSSIVLNENSSLTIVSCFAGGTVKHTIYYEGAVGGASIKIYGGNIGAFNYTALNNLSENIELYGGHYLQDVSDLVDVEHVVASGDVGDPEYNPTYNYAVYNRGTSTVSVNSYNRPYNGSAITQGVDFTTNVNSYADAVTDIKYYTDAECTQEISYEDTLNAGVYYIKAIISGKYYEDEKLYYPAAEYVSTMNIYKITPVVNVSAVIEGTLYAESEFPELNYECDDVDGVVAWEEGQTLVPGTQSYNWIFTPSDTVNYETVSGSLELVAVERSLVGLTIEKEPDKTHYVAFETFDKTGLIVKAELADGQILDVTDEIVIGNGSGITLLYNENGVQNIEISYTYWTGSESVTKTVSLTVTVSKLSVGVPVAPSFVYDGNEHTAFLDGEYYSVAENSAVATDAGVYYAVLILNDTGNCIWDGSDEDGDGEISVQFTIDKARFDMSGVSFENVTVVFDGNQHLPTLTGTLPKDEDGREIAVSYDSPHIDAGEYNVTVNFSTESSNYYAPEPKYAVLTIVPMSVNVIWGNTKFYESGEERAPEATAVGVDGESIQIEVAGAATEVGIYTATATTQNGNYILTNSSTEFEIKEPFKDFTLVVEYKELYISYAEGNDLLEYSVDDGAWSPLSDSGRIPVEISDSWEVSIRYAEDTAVIKDITVYTTADNVLIYLCGNLNEDALKNKPVIDNAEAWLSVATGDKTQANIKLATAKNDYNTAMDKLSESINSALYAASNVTGKKVAAAIAMAAGISGAGAAFGVLAMRKKGDKKDEKNK